MNKNQEEIAEQIITFLKARISANRKNIGKHIEEGQYSNKLKSILDYLVESKYITKKSEEVYTIAPRGERFMSFNEELENEGIEVRLAKSNIAANELQKIIAERNEQNEKKNRIHRTINTIVTIVLCLLTAIQVILLIQQSE